MICWLGDFDIHWEVDRLVTPVRRLDRGRGVKRHTVSMPRTQDSSSNVPSADPRDWSALLAAEGAAELPYSESNPRFAVRYAAGDALAEGMRSNKNTG